MYLVRGWCPLSSRVCLSGCCSHWSPAGSLCWSRGCPDGGLVPVLWPAPHGPPCPPASHGKVSVVWNLTNLNVFKILNHHRTLGDVKEWIPLALCGSSPGVVTSAPWWLLGSVVSLLSLLLFRVLIIGWSYGPGLAQSCTKKILFS